MEVKPLIPIGSEIIVDKSKIEKLLAKNLFEDLPLKIKGKVIDYKMTDGMGIGYVLLTDKNLKIWIFNNELNLQTKKEYDIEDIKEVKQIRKDSLYIGGYKMHYILKSNRSIKSILNPISIANWMIFAIKDVF